MLIGQWKKPLAGRARLALPAPVRPALIGGGILTRGIDGGLWLFPHPAWQQLQRRMATLPFFHPARREVERFLFGGAQLCQLDPRGRLALPATLREWAEIEDEAVIVGMNDFLEIWSPGRWATAERAMLAGASEAATRLWGSE